MDTSLDVNISLDDLVFRHRNKAYGAYFLRRYYAARLRNSVLGALMVCGVLVGLSLVLARLNSTALAAKRMGGVVVLEDVPKEDVAKPKPMPQKVPPKTAAPPPASIVPTVQHIAADPVEDKQVKNETPPASKEKLDDAMAGAQTKAGDPNGVDPATLTTPPGKGTPQGTSPANPPVVASTGGGNEPVKDTVLNISLVQKKPSFGDGGEAELFKFLRANIKYPAIARETNIQGTVYISFVVGKDGVIRNAQVVRGVGGGCSEEALRVVNSMPPWNPGIQNGHPVSVRFTMPIKFALN